MQASGLLIQIAHLSCEIQTLSFIFLRLRIHGDLCADAAQDDNVMHTIVTSN